MTDATTPPSDRTRPPTVPGSDGTFAHARVARWARESPDRSALHFEGASTTFAALQQRSDRLAAAMAGLGVRPGDRVGLLLRRSPDLVAALLAVLQSGATYVPLDPKLPETRLVGMVVDAEVSLIIRDADVAPAWIAAMAAPPTTVRIGDLVACVPTGSTDCGTSGGTSCGTFGGEEAEASQLAYILFTSGSTGRPKGVEITHRNLCCILDAWGEVAGPAADGRAAVHLFHSTIAFDASLTEFLWPLSVGRTVAVAPERDSAAGLHDGLGALIEAAGVTHVQCTPTRAVLMLADPDDRRALRSVDHILVGGEVLSTSLAHELAGAGVGRITNIYGPTECSVWSLFQPLGDQEGTTVPIGRTLDGARAVVVDDALAPVADGTAGELLIVGAFVGRGYAGRPDLTAERFIELEIDGRVERCYRTGDLVTRRPDGVHAYHGRIDTQVKLRGHRIELGEVEAALGALADVQLAVAALHRGGEEGTDRLIALVVPRNGSNTLAVVGSPEWEESLRAAVAARLPALMVPTRVLAVESFAYTPSGKVDRNSIPERIAALLHRDVAATASSDPLDAMCADLALVLDRDAVGPDDDFFALGGHSLQGVHLLARIRDRTGIELGLRVLLDAPTPRALVTVLAHPQGMSPMTPLVRYGPARSDRQIYLIHGAGGNVLGFRELAIVLREDVEVVGIQAHGVEPGRTPDRTVAEMAHRYADAIQADAPDGPYDLGGYSDGGTIAISVAHELHRRGGRVRSLVLIDSYRGGEMPEALMERLRNLVRNARDRGGRPLGAWVRTVIAARRERHERDVTAERASSLGFVALNDCVERAVAESDPPPTIDAPALLLRSTYHNPLKLHDYTLAASSTTSLEEAWIDAAHLRMLEPGALAAVSDAIRRFLRATRS